MPGATGNTKEYLTKKKENEFSYRNDLVLCQFNNKESVLVL